MYRAGRARTSPCCAAAVDAAGGEVFATMGDGIAAAFPSAEAAVQAAIAAQRADAGDRPRRADGHPHRRGRARRRRLPRPPGQPGRPHHGGRPRRPDPAVGRDRVARSAPGPRPVELVDLGTHRLRDLAEPERLWQVRPPRPRRRSSRRCGASTQLREQPAGATLVARRARRSTSPARGRAASQRHRIVTLTGVGGVGKTRLGRAGRRRRCCRGSASVWFVELASVTDPDDVADAIARTIGAAAVHRSARRGAGAARRRAHAARRSTTASTSSTAPPR